ncbi:cyclic lactone autoinducer peptide [Xylanibacillus composti]|nr:cyclic lactone autoinducer peptide [Xylanibacillus composti]
MKKKVIRYAIISISALLYFVSIISVSTACWVIGYRPEVPEELLKKKN